MSCYRIKHIPSGLYYCRSRTVRFLAKPKKGNSLRVMVKSNLSKTGRVYLKNPGIKYVENGFYDHITLKKVLESYDGTGEIYYTRTLYSKFVQADWIVEEI